MFASARARFAILLTTVSGAVGCASAPSLPRSVTVAEGQPTAVSLHQTQGNLVLRLQNETSGFASDVYTANSANSLLKVVPDQSMQALLDVFTAKGLFAAAPNAVPADARDVLTVEHGGERWVWARRHLGIRAEEQPFHEAKAYFLELYNSSTAYHGVGQQLPNFRDEAARARGDANAAKQKLEAARRRSQ